MSTDSMKLGETDKEIMHLESHHQNPNMPAIEKGQDLLESEYPDGLREMSDPPTLEMLRMGAQLEREDQTRNMPATIRKYGRMCLMAVPYLLACIGQGYDNGAAGITQSMPAFLIKFGEFSPATHGLIVPSVWLSLWGSLLQLGTAIGAFSCGYLLDKFGPKRTTMAASAFMLIPIAIQVSAESRGQLLAGKLLGGIPMGIYIVCAANYIGASTTVKLRGPLSSMLALVLIAGIVLGLTVGYEQFLVFSDWQSWRLVLAIQWVFPILTIVLLFFVSDSPVYWVQKNQPEKAMAQLRRLYGASSPDLRARLATIQLDVAVENEQHAKVGKASFKELFSSASDRRRTMIAMGIWIVFNFGGSSFTGNGLYFLVTGTTLPITTIFPIVISCLALGALINFLSGYLLEKIGRRGLFVYGGFFYAAVLATLGGLGWATSSSGKFALAMLINLVIVVQQVVQNAPCYTLSSEIASLRLRGKTQSIFQNPGNLGAKTALIFAGLTFIGCIWGFLCIVSAILELDVLFEHNVPTRKFRTQDVSALIRSQTV